MNQRLKRKIEKRRRQQICVCRSMDYRKVTRNIQGIILRHSVALADMLLMYL